MAAMEPLTDDSAGSSEDGSGGRRRCGKRYAGWRCSLTPSIAPRGRSRGACGRFCAALERVALVDSRAREDGSRGSDRAANLAGGMVDG